MTGDHEIERLREKARHDEAQALHHAKLEGIQQGIQKGIAEKKLEIARNLLKINLPLGQIAMVTGLSQEDIKHLVP